MTIKTIIMNKLVLLALFTFSHVVDAFFPKPLTENIFFEW